MNFCVIGFSGKRCEVNIDDCDRAELAGCPNCVDGVETAYCRCDHGKTGVTCSKGMDTIQVLNLQKGHYEQFCDRLKIVT